MRSETYYTFTLSLYNITQSVDSVMNQPMFTPKTQFIRVIIIIDYFFLGIGSCFGGLSLKYSNSRFITSETGRACSSLILSRNFLIESVVRNANNSDLFSFIICLQCITISLDNKEKCYYTMYNNMILLWQV